MLSWPLVRYVLEAAARDRLIISFLLLTLVEISLSFFIGSATVVEKQQFVSTYAAGGLRLLCVMGIVLFTTFFIQRSFEQRDVEYLLSRPISRVSFILSHVMALVMVAAILAGVAGLAVSLVSLSIINSFYSIWIVSLFFETALMGLMALFFAMVLPSATVAALFSMFFYVLARMIGQLLGIVDAGAEFWGNAFLEPGIKAVAVVVPRFDLMTQTSWLIYGPQGHEGWLLLFAQTGAFGLLVVMAAILDLVRRQF